ncbi:helix-turn-helix transcriptional regulator [Mycolicibacterium conceptionense]|uniref:helix-turn-helix transcriptional regulator n=1 Tax=Mycolicibacterium conceptionense TaxID=451644 RepID=UPI003204CFA6
MAPRRPRKINSSSLVDYGSPVNRDVNIDEASRKLRVSKTAVRKAMRQEVINLRSVIYRGITGRRDADVGELTNVMGMLQAVYGYGPRGSKVNAKAAAEALGVSAATVRRWANGSQQPSPDHLKAIKTAARQAASTKAGRRAATEIFRNSDRGRKALAHGARIHISGYQGPENYAWERDRDVSSDPLTPTEIEELLRAYENGGDKGLLDYLADIMDPRYMHGSPWEFATISDFWIGDRR